MAGPSVMVRILGDVTGLGSSFQAAGAKGASAAGQMHSAFSGMLGTLNSTGVLGPFGGALATADQSLQNMGGHAKDASGKMIAIGGAAAGVGLALSAMGSKDAAAHAQLQAAVGATGKSYDAYSAKIDEAIKHQAHFGNTASETSDALRILTQATGDPKKALDLLNTATDLATAKHESLDAAAATLGKAYNGSGKVMKEFGITVSATGTATKELSTATAAHTKAVDAVATSSRALQELEAADNSTGKPLTILQTMKLQDAQNKVNDANLKLTTSTANLNKAHHDVATGASLNQKALDELGKKLSGQASAQADTFSGHMKSLRAEIENHVSQLGQKYGPALTTAGAAMAGLGSAVKIAQGSTELFGAAQKIGTGIQEGATAAVWLFNAAWEANPLGIIVIAIIAVIAIIVLLLVHFGIMKGVINDLWSFMKDAWNGIRDAIKVVFDWVVANWPLLLGILTGPFGLVLGEIIKHWSTVEGWLKSVPGEIANLAKGMWDGIGNAFVDVINFIINAWNSIKFTTPSVDILGFHTPSVTLGVPHIPDVPHLAQGGLITASGLVYAHAGEAITPAPQAQAQPRGPAVVVHNAHFSKDIDVDAFMRRAAWVARTRSL